MVTFWQLGLPELAVPDKAYAKTISRLEASMARLETWTALRSLTAEWVDAYRSNKVELGALVDKIKAEQRDQEKLVATAAARLDSEKDHWFPGECVTYSFDRAKPLNILRDTQKNPLSGKNVTWPDFCMPLASIHEPFIAQSMLYLSLASVYIFTLQERRIFRYYCSMKR